MDRIVVGLLYDRDAHGSREAFCRAVSAAAEGLDWRFQLVGSGARGIDRARSLGTAGVIGPLGRSDLIEQLRASGLAAVSVYGGAATPGLDQVGISDQAVGELAGRRLLELGHRHLAYLGFRDDPALESVDRHRRSGLAAAARAGGARFHTAGCHGLDLAAWLAALPEPCALLCADDPLAAEVALVAERLGRTVPESLAILGINDDPLICELSSPPLASVQLGAGRLGALAVACLQRRLALPEAEAEVQLLLPAGVSMRASLGIARSLPEPIRKALHLIDTQAWRQGDPEQVARTVGRNRRVLDNLFRDHLGCTVAERLRARRLAEVQRLLLDPRQSVAAIAAATGFSNPSHLIRSFRAALDCTPDTWRRGQRPTRVDTPA